MTTTFLLIRHAAHDPASIATVVSGDWGSKLIRLNEAA